MAGLEDRSNLLFGTKSMSRFCGHRRRGEGAAEQSEENKTIAETAADSFSRGRESATVSISLIAC